MTAADRTVVAAIVFMYVAIPLYGTFEVLDPARPPIPQLVSLPGAVAIALAMLTAAAICTWGAFRRPPPRRIALAQLLPGAAIVPAALFGFDPPTGFDPWMALGEIGYPLDDRAAAVRAFHNHFRGIDSDTLDAQDLPILYALTRRIERVDP